jgi:hypothetical protein
LCTTGTAFAGQRLRGIKRFAKSAQIALAENIMSNQIRNVGEGSPIIKKDPIPFDAEMLAAVEGVEAVSINTQIPRVTIYDAEGEIIDQWEVKDEQYFNQIMQAIALGERVQ